MRKIFIALIFITNIGFAGDLKSFDKIKSEFQNDGDLARVGYIFNRCASLQLVNSALLSRGGSNAAAERFKKGALDYIELSETIEKSIDDNRKVKRSNKDRLKSINISLLAISQEYQALTNKNYAKSGNYFIDDDQLMSEIEICQNPNKLVEWMTEDK
jgi:hypothetical protein